jgi:hypothetical protein
MPHINNKRSRTLLWAGNPVSQKGFLIKRAGVQKE